MTVVSLDEYRRRPAAVALKREQTKDDVAGLLAVSAVPAADLLAIVNLALLIPPPAT